MQARTPDGSGTLKQDLMPIKRLNANDTQYLAIPRSEIIDLFLQIVKAYDENNLSLYGVKKTWDDDLVASANDIDYFFSHVDPATLQLIFLTKYMGCLVHKDLVSQFVKDIIPKAGLDQQVRHLGTQKNWYVLNRSAKIPNTKEKVPSGYQFLFTLDSPNPRVVQQRLKRAGRLSAQTFEELKMAYGGCCATCGVKEGTRNPLSNQIVALQQGHMDPSKPLTLANTIPQCQFCNQTYQDFFVFDENGRVKAVYNPAFVLRSTPEVQKSIYELLREKLGK